MDSCDRRVHSSASFPTGESLFSTQFLRTNRLQSASIKQEREDTSDFKMSKVPRLTGWCISSVPLVWVGCVYVITPNWAITCPIKIYLWLWRRSTQELKKFACFQGEILAQSHKQKILSGVQWNFLLLISTPRRHVKDFFLAIQQNSVSSSLQRREALGALVGFTKWMYFAPPFMMV